ncbi:macrolide family glycosyltransferase [Streptomyces sp. NRRL WC-3742]|uniref:macrolide family glycosyltransferase n=1 Tax=Streptomyces sp. NRRL WC-3742 TaxID=1463934 RepID=UPI0004C549AB|nr:macrolide family glycosyltransferase [Streptomyces sp. NRRL WC-3742]
MSSHIAVFNIPAVGHINPTLSVVEELVRRGNRVTYTVTEHFRASVEASGAEPVVYTSVFGDYYTHPYTPEALPAEGLRFFNEAVETLKHFEAVYENDRPDVILYDQMAWAARFLGAKWNIPTVRLHPSYGSNEVFSIQSRFPLASEVAPEVIEMMGQLAAFLPSVGLEGVGPVEFFTKIEDLALIFLPREFHYDGDTFDERFVFTGPCLGDRSAFQGSWTNPGGKPVLFISLGTAFTGSAEFFPAAIEAFADSEYRVVLAIGNHADPAALGELPANIEVHQHVNQLDVLSQAALFVTHGGMNSAMEALAHGVPMVVVPQMSEQQATAERVEELGLGAYLPSEKATAASLREAVETVLGNPATAEKLGALRDAIRGTDGPVVAADAVEGYLKRLG